MIQFLSYVSTQCTRTLIRSWIIEFLYGSWFWYIGLKSVGWLRQARVCTSQTLVLIRRTKLISVLWLLQDNLRPIKGSLHNAHYHQGRSTMVRTVIKSGTRQASAEFEKYTIGGSWLWLVSLFLALWVWLNKFPGNHKLASINLQVLI